jgi:phosphatidylinositol alpha-mannosyltransferase
VKVGLLCENYFPTLGGEQEHLLHLRRHLECPRDGARPAEVRIITPHPAIGDEWYGPTDDAHVLRPATAVRIQAEGTTAQATVTPRAAWALKRLFARERFDLLHVHAPCDLGLPAWALWTFDGPIVGTLHSYFRPMGFRALAAPWYRYAMRRLTRVIAVSEAARNAMSRYADFDCTIIENGVDVAAFSGGTPIGRFADGMLNILMLGRLEPRNGVDVVIDAFARLAGRHAGIRLLLAGDGPYRPRYERQVRRLPAGIARRIEFLGAVWRERPDLYASAHCFALAARQTSFSILLLEALSAGLRVAALPGEGTSQAGPHWGLAEMAASDSAQDYADALARALVPMTPRDASRAREMATLFDWSRIVTRIRGVYEEALHGTYAAAS